MAVQLNHTIVWCKDKHISANFLTNVLGLPPAEPFPPFMVVTLENGVSLDFHQTAGPIASQHYAFLVSDAEFDDGLKRIQYGGLGYWADPGRQHANEINHEWNGRGVYFNDPDGHLLELITTPYGTETE